jgi:hypothetical protein
MEELKQITKWCPQHGYPTPCEKCGYFGSSAMDMIKYIKDWRELIRQCEDKCYGKNV